MTQSFSDLSILVAEDTKTNQVLFVNLLNSLGCSQIDVAPDGAKAFELAQARAYHVIFMDHVMPEMDGVEATKKILEFSKNQQKNMPFIVALTGNQEQEMLDLYKRVGMKSYLKKPLKKDELISCLKAYLEDNSYSSNISKESNLDELDILDYAYLNANFSKNPQILFRVYQIAEKEIGPLMEKIEESLISSSYDDVVLYAHRMKGMLANLGGKKSSDFAKKLESAGKEKHISKGSFDDFQNLKKETVKFNASLMDFLHKTQLQRV